jgi:hypothetical protein
MTELSTPAIYITCIVLVVVIIKSILDTMLWKKFKRRKK